MAQYVILVIVLVLCFAFINSLKRCCYQTPRVRKIYRMGLNENIDNAMLLSDININEILRTASSKAFNGGTAGAYAGALQVLSLMWLRTTMNYQYRYGVNSTEALQKLYADGGIARFYQGLPFAIVQGTFR